jgi:hypothetical protein
MNCAFLQRDGGRCDLSGHHCEPLSNERRNEVDRIADPSCPNNDPIWQMIQRCWKIVGRWTRDDEECYKGLRKV